MSQIFTTGEETTFPTDEEIKAKIDAFLISADLNTLTLRTLLVALESEFGVLLQSKRDLIKGNLTSFINKSASNNNSTSTPPVAEEIAVVTKKEANTNNNTNEEELGEEDVDNDIFETLDAVGEYQPPDELVSAAVEIKPKKGGFSAPVQLSNDLSEFCGVSIIPRTEVTKRIWDYVKLHDLQNPKDRREIICDAKLEKLFKRKSINMFKMTKALSAMMKSFDELQDFKITKADQKLVENVDKYNNRQNKRKCPSTTAFSSSSGQNAQKKRNVKNCDHKIMKAEPGVKKNNKLYTLSPELAAFVGTPTETRFQLTSKLWTYIKANNLQNPEKKQFINNDTLFKSIFEVDTMHMFEMSKLLGKHLS